MRAPWRRVAAFCLLAGLGLPWLGGCENPTDAADKKAQQDVESHKPQARKVEDYQRASAELSKDAKSTGISDRVKVDINRQLAQAEINAADLLTHEANVKESEANRLVGDIRGLTAQIKANNVSVAAYDAMKPDATLAMIDQSKKNVTTGDGNGQWVAGDAGAIPSEATVKAEADKLNEQIKALTDKKASLEQERTKNANEAATLQEEARKIKGPEALDKSMKAAELNKKARETQWEIEQTDAQLAHAQQDLKVAEVRQQVYAEAIKTLDERTAKVNEQWKDVQDQQKALADQSEKLLGKPGISAAPPPSAPGEAGKAAPLTPAEIEILTTQNNITTKSEQIRQAVAEADAYRAKAMPMYESALGHVKESADAAARTVSALKAEIAKPSHQGAPEAAAWKSLVETLGPAQFEMNTASIHAKVAQSYADRAVGIHIRDQARTQLDGVLKNAHPALNMPEAMAGLTPGTEADAARAKADEAFKASESLLRKVGGISEEADVSSGGADNDTARSAKVALINTLYNHGQFLARFGDPQSGTLLSSAGKLAKEIDGDALASNRPLPYFAPDLMEAAGIKRAATQPFVLPTATASGAPATQPEGSTGTGSTVFNDLSGNDSPEQAAVRGVIGKFTDALAAGDAAAAQAVAAEDPANAERINTMIRFSEGSKKVEEAIKAKFGDEANPVISGMQAGSEMRKKVVAAFQIAVNGDSATAQLGPKTVYTLKQTNGEWKILPLTDPNDLATLSKVVVANTSLEQLAADIAGGKYAKPTDAVMAMLPIVMSVNSPGDGSAPLTTATTQGTSPAPPPAEGTTPAPPPAEGTTPAPPPAEGTTPPASAPAPAPAPDGGTPPAPAPEGTPPAPPANQ